MRSRRIDEQKAVFPSGSWIYTFEGWTFQSYCAQQFGPWPLKQNGAPRAKAGRQFEMMWRRFDALPETEKEKHRVGGGCEVLRMKGVRADAK
jgi:hypothetical protein